MEMSFDDSWIAFVLGVDIIAEAGERRCMSAEHDIIYLPRPDDEDAVARVLALGHGWHDCKDVDALGYFT